MLTGELWITSLSLGNSSSIKFFTIFLKKKSLLIVPKTLWPILLRVITAQSFAMARQEQERPSQWVEAHRITSTEDSFQEAFLKYFKKSEQSLSKQLLYEFRMLKFTMSWCLIFSVLCLLMSNQEAFQFKKIQMETFEWRDWLWTCVQTKKMHSTFYSKEILTGLFHSTNLIMQVRDLIASLQFM